MLGRLVTMVPGPLCTITGLTVWPKIELIALLTVEGLSQFTDPMPGEDHVRAQGEQAHRHPQQARVLGG